MGNGDVRTVPQKTRGWSGVIVELTLGSPQSWIQSIMLEFETLLAFGIGAGLVALGPLVAAVAGKNSKVTGAVTGTGRTITKQGLKVGIVIADKTSGAVQGIGRGLAEIGETFTDILAEAKADLDKPNVKAASITAVK